jgi:hypothetical protein
MLGRTKTQYYPAFAGECQPDQAQQQGNGEIRYSTSSAITCKLSGE